MKIEIACFNLESAIIADRAGAHRIELCENYSEGGVTPNLEIVAEARDSVKCDLFVMIRPRSGGFVYSNAEFEEMKTSILLLKPKVDGFVFGILNEDNSINEQQNIELVSLAAPLPCTFHRAFDKVSDPLKSLENVINCGFSTILTSGTKSNVIEGKTMLKKMVDHANGRITIMPGGGLRSTNLNELHAVVNASFYHSSAITNASDIADFDEIIALKNITF